MEYLHIIEVDWFDRLHRKEVAVLGQEVINGVKCFFHSTRGKFVVSHLESGAMIAESPNRAESIALAEFRLADKGRWEMVLSQAQATILNAGHIYPVNPVAL